MRECACAPRDMVTVEARLRDAIRASERCGDDETRRDAAEVWE